MAMKKVVVGKKMKQSGLTLPDEVVEALTEDVHVILIIKNLI